MPTSISLRVYSITLHKKQKTAALPLDYNQLVVPLESFLINFVDQHQQVMRNETEDRSWFFEQKAGGNSDAFGSKGYIRYGTYGFESDFVDNRTQVKRYRRQVNDVEQIPLFYQFWFPNDTKIRGYAVFQSFQGRSCVQLVMSRMNEKFQAENEGYSLKFKKLLPVSPEGGLYGSAGVKRLTLFKKNASADLADKYLGQSPVETVDIELAISARRRSSLGIFDSLRKPMKQISDGVISFDGIVFSEAVADVRVGSRTRKVTLFGGSEDAGVIDITDDVKRAPDGHPTFQSLVKEVNEILESFHEVCAGT